MKVRVEKATSGRSSCDACLRLIAFGQWRVLVSVPYDARKFWRYDVACAAALHPRLVEPVLARKGIPVELRRSPSPNLVVPADVKAALHRQPDDDVARRIYADWLEARGSTLGRFVLACLDRSSLLIRELRRRHQSEWVDGLRPQVFTWDHGGLIEAARVDSVKLEEIPRLLADVLALPAAVCLRELEVGGWPFEDTVDMLSERAPRTLRRLRVAFVESLSTLRLPHLETLELFGGDGTFPVLRAECFPALRVLRLEDRSPRSEDFLRRLARTPLANQLSRLELTGTRFPDDLSDLFPRGLVIQQRRKRSS